MSFIAVLLSPFLLIFKLLGLFLVPIGIIAFIFWLRLKQNPGIKKPFTRPIPKTPTKMTPCQTCGTLIPITQAYQLEEKFYCNKMCCEKSI